MTSWKKYRLSDIGILARGKSKHRPRDASHLYGGKYPFIQTGDIKNATHKISNYTQTYSEAGLAQSKLWDVGTICITIAANIGDTAILTFPACFPDSVLGFIPNNLICNSEYIEYMLQFFKQDVQKHSIGSVQENINLGTFQNIEFPLPDLPTQIRIASILSSLDDKIELNRRVNQTLEQMARALFNHYFVDNIDPENLPEGWKVGKVGEIVELKYGKALKENQRKIGCYAVVGSGGIIGYHDEFICKGKGIVVGRKGNSGAVSWLHESFYPIDTTFFVSDLIGIKDLYYYYFLLKSLNLKNLNSDSAVPGLNRNEAHNQEIVIPDNKKINEFNNSVCSFFNRIHVNLKEIKTLTTIRDTLLPKLMSGEIDVDALLKGEEQSIENLKTA